MVSARIELVARVEEGPPVTAEIGEISVQRREGGRVDEGELSSVMAEFLTAVAAELTVDDALSAKGSEGEGVLSGDSAVS